MSAAALLVACTGVTPAEAVRAAKKVAFASDAGSVNKIKASRSPKPGQLLPLGDDGKFPPSVLSGTSGTRGPRGLQGPTGTDGARGPSDVYATARNGIALPVPPQVPGTVVSLTNVPAGKYLAIASGSLVYQDVGAEGQSYWRCWISINGDAPGNASVSWIGPDSARAGSFALQQAMVLSAPSTIRAMCQHDGATPAGNPRVDHATLSAIRTDNLVIQ